MSVKLWTRYHSTTFDWLIQALLLIQKVKIISFIMKVLKLSTESNSFYTVNSWVLVCALAVGLMQCEQSCFPQHDFWATQVCRSSSHGTLFPSSQRGAWQGQGVMTDTGDFQLLRQQTGATEDWYNLLQIAP